MLMASSQVLIEVFDRLADRRQTICRRILDLGVLQDILGTMSTG
jgi:hypothetical protein